ncbi:hypothetical protein PSHT_04104 [Puccinia striiformis]|uniref:1,3-beta-glucanosyltransferase n=1 Tax=Puccinia striiformis TaxID=27350 RepID=A0A2S4WDY1_9BASI|nr:hypothetical protein PSHT_04104 [Puccinia striiformis]
MWCISSKREQNSTDHVKAYTQALRNLCDCYEAGLGTSRGTNLASISLNLDDSQRLVMKCQGWALISVWLLISVQVALSRGVLQITRMGRYLYDANGKRFYIKGVAFRKPENIQNQGRGVPGQAAGFSDPLGDINSCKHAIKDFKRVSRFLSATIRRDQSMLILYRFIYNYNPEIDHSACMNALDKSGIYVIADIKSPLSGSTNIASQHWDVDVLTQYINQIDSLRSFPNLLAFNIGDEFITSSEAVEAGPYIKARVRDVKLYLKSVNSTALVSYASADGKKFPSELARFLSCHSGGPSAELDLFGLNNYRWCGDSSFESAYQEIALEFQGLAIAAYFSEFGCLTPGKPRLWNEIPTLFSTLMSDLWSGGLRTTITRRNKDMVFNEAQGKSVRNEDFDTLAQRYQQVKPPDMPKLTSLVSPKQKCSSTNANSFAITSVLPPQPNVEACNCVEQVTLSCQVRKNASLLVITELLDNLCKTLRASLLQDLEGVVDRFLHHQAKGFMALCRLLCDDSSLHQFRKACNFSGNATVQNPIKVKSVEELYREASKCLEINANKGIPSKGTRASQDTPAQINSTAYKQSLSGARTESRARSSACTLTPRRPQLLTKLLHADQEWRNVGLSVWLVHIIIFRFVIG